uniref:Uncharacterized protein n=1 Tax=Melopsittacus undulatus TaxID=13146 RepID=A0A8V5HHH5_MELUD
GCPRRGSGAAAAPRPSCRGPGTRRPRARSAAAAGGAGSRLTASPPLLPQSQPDGEPLPGALEKEDARSAPSTPSTPSVCSPPSSSSSTPSAGKNVCSSCGLEILDRYLLKVNNLIWHVRCLECSVCRTSLRQQHSCYIKNKEIFCKMDYFSGAAAG